MRAIRIRAAFNEASAPAPEATARGLLRGIFTSTGDYPSWPSLRCVPERTRSCTDVRRPEAGPVFAPLPERRSSSAL